MNKKGKYEYEDQLLDNLKIRIIYYLDNIKKIGLGQIKKLINEDIDYYLSKRKS